jgi:hypothetical protein
MISERGRGQLEGQRSGIDNREVSEGLADRAKRFQAAAGLAARRMYNDGQVRESISS